MPHLNEGHVCLVNIGSLFAIYFNGNEMLVEDGSDRLALKGLVFHYVTPMTRRITDWKRKQFNELSQKNGIRLPDKKMGRWRDLAFAKASSPHGNLKIFFFDGQRDFLLTLQTIKTHQSTGLFLCCNKYGDFSLARRFLCCPPAVDDIAAPVLKTRKTRIYKTKV
jgi:hypothetical protein